MEYSLKLCNGQKWSLIDATQGLVWLEEFIKFLGVTPGEKGGDFSIIFTRTNSPEPETLVAVLSCAKQFNWPQEWWELQTSEGSQWWTNKKFPEKNICLFPPEFPRQNSDRETYHAIGGLFYCIYSQAAAFQGLPLHAALIELSGQAALIVAPSGTGKTTCCQRVPPPWQALCDEEVLMLPVSPAKWSAHPFINISDFVARGKRTKNNIQTAYPLGGIFFLEQGTTDGCAPITKAQAAANLFRAASEVFVRYRHWNNYVKKQSRLRQFHSACALAGDVPCYKLSATRTGNFWSALETAIFHES